MKKIAIFISIILSTQAVKAQSNITDTTQYLRDSIETRKNYFSSVYFSYFLSNLRLGVKYYSIGVPLPSELDTMTINRITLYFNTNEDVVIKGLQNQKVPYIELMFVSPMQIPKAYLKKGGILDWTTEWNTAKANFFANRVIYGVNVRGL